MQHGFLSMLALFVCCTAGAQKAFDADSAARYNLPAKQTYYGIASYYADKFHGRQTANGEMYSKNKLTAACNILPLGSWIRVTNMRNKKSVIVKTNDRLHPRMKRIVDLSRLAAQQLGYIGRGLTQVKVEVLEGRLVAGR